MAASAAATATGGGVVGELWKAAKDRILSLSVADKRKLYKCGSDFVTLDSVPTWSQHCQEHPPKVDPYDEKAFSVDNQINEKVSVWKGDVTRLEVDCVVNDADETLLGGRGEVDKGIHAAAGEHLLEECKTLGRCLLGSAKITGGYNLPAKYVIHAVGPKEQKHVPLKAAYLESLKLMQDNGLRSIAFPCISSTDDYAVEDSAHVALLAIRHFLERDASRVDRIIFAANRDEDFKVYETYMPRYNPVTD